MSNLLSIEQAFLSNAEIQQALNMTEVTRLQRSIDTAQKKKFNTTLELSKVVSKSYEWFKSDEAQAKFNAEGISWTSEDFALKVFGWQKSFFHKVIKVSKVETEVVERFDAECKRLEREGEKPKRSIEALLKFAKAVEASAKSSGDGEGDGEGDEPQVETRPQTAFTLTFKDGHNPNVSIRIDENGVMSTTNEAIDIKRALAFLVCNEQYIELMNA
jgi:hypothetical protein